MPANLLATGMMDRFCIDELHFFKMRANIFLFKLGVIILSKYFHVFLAHFVLYQKAILAV